MLDSRQKNLIIESFEKGYRIDSYGRCYNKNNIERSLAVNSSGYKCFTVKSKEFKNGTRLFVHNIGSKETPSPLGKGRNCPRFLLWLIFFVMYFLISEKSCIFTI